jgi:hypothetical protein
MKVAGLFFGSVRFLTWTLSIVLWLASQAIFNGDSSCHPDRRPAAYPLPSPTRFVRALVRHGENVPALFAIHFRHRWTNAPRHLNLHPHSAFGGDITG